MANNNAANLDIDGQTGTGQFVGSDTPTFSTQVDMGGADSLAVPNGASPSVTANGQIALDTSIANFNPMLKYHDGTSEYSTVGMPSADLDPINNYTIAYDSSSQEFTMKQKGNGGIINYSISASAANSSTNGTSFINTALNGTIVPVSATSVIYIRAFLYGSSTSDTVSDIYGSYQILRGGLGGMAFDDSNKDFGRESRIVNVGNTSYFPVYLSYIDPTSSSSGSKFYRVRYKSSNASSSIAVNGGTFSSILLLYEVEI